MKTLLPFIGFFLSLGVFPLNALEEDFAELLARLSVEDRYFELKGSGYSVRNFEDGKAVDRHGEWNFTTVISANPENPKMYVSLKPMVHPRSESSDVISFNREVWYDGDIWIYSEQRLDDEMNPIREKSVVLNDQPPFFLGRVDRDGDFFGLTFIPWRYGVFSDYSLIKALKAMESANFSISKHQGNDSIFSYKLTNMCNETTLLFNGSRETPLKMLSVVELYNICSDHPPSVTTTEFSDFVPISKFSDFIAFPMEFTKTYEDHEGRIKSKRFGRLESVRLVSKSYVSELFKSQENLSGKPLIDRTSGVIVLPNGEVRNIQ